MWPQVRQNFLRKNKKLKLIIWAKPKFKTSALWKGSVNKWKDMPFTKRKYLYQDKTEWNFHILMARVQNGTIILENSLTIYIKWNVQLPYNAVKLLLSIYQKKESIIPQKDLFMKVQSNFVHDSPKVGEQRQKQIFTNW